jgi:CubicO group peptidase (beta-lactamase class C family)
LRQLVSHSAGLTVHGFPGYRHDAELPTTLQILDGVRPTNTFGVRVDTIPGTQFRYSGGGTVVMQQLLEDVTGTPFRRLVRELVLEPLGMSDSGYAQPLPEVLHGQAATAHDDVGQPIEGRWHTYAEVAAAGLWTTPADLCRFAIAVQRAYAGADDALLSPGLARELLTPQIPTGDRIGGFSELGLGLFLGDGGRRFGHGGSNKGFKCHLLVYRDTGQGAAVMTNGDNGAYVVQRVLAQIASSYDWPEYPSEVDSREVPDESVLAELVGTYWLGERLTFEVVRGGSGLDVTFRGQPAVRFVPVGADRFGTAVADSELLIRDGEVVFVQNGEELPTWRV